MMISIKPVTEEAAGLKANASASLPKPITGTFPRSLNSAEKGV